MTKVNRNELYNDFNESIGEALYQVMVKHMLAYKPMSDNEMGNARNDLVRYKHLLIECISNLFETE